MRKRSIQRLLILAGIVSFSLLSQAEIRFDGQWENYSGSFYGPDGWHHGAPVGKPTGNGNWNDFYAFWDPVSIPNTWLYLTSWDQDRIRLEVDPTSPKHGMVARFEVRSGDHRDGHYSGERSELYTMLDSNRKKLPVTAASGHEFYGISVKLSPDWVSPQHESPQKGSTLWGSFMQLHSPNAYNSPPALDLMAENDFHLDMDSGELDQVVQDPRTGAMKHTKNDSKPLSFTNGDLHRGHWVQFMLDIVWATDTTGSIGVYRRDEGQKNFTQVLDVQGTPTLQFDSFISTDPAQCSSCGADNVTHYWRVGFYRSTSHNQTNVLWLGPIVRGTAFDEVAIAAFGSSGDKISMAGHH